MLSGIEGGLESAWKVLGADGETRVVPETGPELGLAGVRRRGGPLGNGVHRNRKACSTCRPKLLTHETKRMGMKGRRVARVEGVGSKEGKSAAAAAAGSVRIKGVAAYGGGCGEDKSVVW